MQQLSSWKGHSYVKMLPIISLFSYNIVIGQKFRIEHDQIGRALSWPMLYENNEIPSPQIVT